MAQDQNKLLPIEYAVSIPIKQQKEYDEYLKKLRDDTEKGTPREKLKGGGKVVSIGSLMDRPMYTPNPNQNNINTARKILNARHSFQKEGSTNVDERIKELEYKIKLILPAIRDQEGADLYERAKEELELLKLKKAILKKICNIFLGYQFISR
jgi:hypothetical protein